MTIKTVGILSTGDMGGAIGGVLRHGGLDVVTSLAGRSELTRLRASEADVRDAGSLDAVVAESDLVISVLVPSEAVPLAKDVADAMRHTGATPVFADCNAIAPRTVARIATLIESTGAVFVDAGIIGAPPKPGQTGTRISCSGPDTALFEELRGHGLDVRRVGPETGQASALKMVYAASTKGTTALWTELLTAAKSMGLLEPLLAEFEAGGGDHHRRMIRAVPQMPRRARRWVGEMEEIAQTFRDLGLTPRILEGAADMFRLVSETSLANQTSREPDPELETLLGMLDQHAQQSGRPRRP